MSALSDPLQVLIAGGGVAALETTLALQALAQDPISIELIAPESEFVYRPLAVAEPFRVGETRRFPLSQLIEAAGATLCRGHVAGVDPDRRIVATDEGAERPYEVLVVALGARPREAVPDALTFSGPESGAALGTVLEETLAGEIRRRAGSTLEPTPFKPVLRGLLLTGMTARFLRAEPGTAHSAIDTEALWWPPAKIVGRHLAPFLASKLGLSEEMPPRSGESVPVEVELDQHGQHAWAGI